MQQHNPPPIVMITDGATKETLILRLDGFNHELSDTRINISDIANNKLSEKGLPDIVVQFLQDYFIRWERRSTNGYEISSKGDKDYSAFYARLPNGDMIEDAYQLDVKGYRHFGDDWKLGKGKPPLDDNMTPKILYQRYKGLWLLHYQWYPEKLVKLNLTLRNNDINVLTDMFANTEVNQARVNAELINEIRYMELEESIKKEYSGNQYVEY